MTPIESWLHDIKPCEKTLVWCHSMDGWDFDAAIANEKCIPTLCDVYNENLLYLSYGRPAFRVQDKPLTMGGAWPAAMLFDSSYVVEGKRMFPFDSGAWGLSLYKAWIDVKAELKNFQISHGDEWIRKHVAAFFGNNENYMLAKSQQPPKPFFKPFEVHSLVHMFLAKSAVKPDNRIMAVELQLAEPLEMSIGALKAVIYPKDLNRDPAFKAFRRKYPNVIYSSYPMKIAATSSLYHETLEQHAYLIQRRLGLI